MLTHHQYTCSQKGQIEATFRSSLGEIETNKLSTQKQSVRYRNNIWLDSYARIRMYRNHSTEEIQEAAFGVMNNHAGKNLQLNITGASGHKKIGFKPKNHFKDGFSRLSVQQDQFFSRDGDNRENGDAYRFQDTNEATPRSKQTSIGKHKDFLYSYDLGTDDKIQKKSRKLVEKMKEINNHREETSDLYIFDWVQLQSEEFLRIATASIDESTAFQRYLQENSVHPNILKQAEEHLNELIINRYGCHILRVLLQKSSTIYDRLVNLVKKEFAYYCCNQFSNKVIQAIAEQDTIFCNYCLEQIYQEWENVKRYIPTSYLLSICLSRVPTTSNQFQLIGQALIARSQSIWKDKYDKRFLLDYLHFCPTGQLDYFFKALNYELYFEKRIQDRYLAQALGILFKRGNNHTQELIIGKLSGSMEYFLRMKNFRLLIVELLEGQREPSSECKRLVETLICAPEIICKYSEIDASAKKAELYMQSPEDRTNM